MSRGVTIEELNFIDTEDGFVREVRVTQVNEVSRRLAVELDAEGRINVGLVGLALSFSTEGLFGLTIREARAVARALDRAADKAVFVQGKGGTP